MFSRVMFSICILLVGCSSKSSPEVTATSTFSRSLPPTWTPTLTLTSTFTLAPTITTPTATISPTLTPTITPTLPPSLTPLPTIDIDELAIKFEILLATNGHCRLPCFWGITPGITSTAELHQFAQQFPTDLVDIENSLYRIYYVTSKTGDTSFSVSFFIRDGLVQSIDPGGDTAKDYVTLPKLLNDYGMPTGVLIGPPEFDDELSMLVLYEDQQFMGKYLLFPNELDNSLYCYDPQSSPYDLNTWAPDRKWQSFVRNDEQSYKPLGDVSNYDISSFRETLRNNNRALCMKIQTDKIPPQ